MARQLGRCCAESFGLPLVKCCFLLMLGAPAGNHVGCVARLCFKSRRHARVSGDDIAPHECEPGQFERAIEHATYLPLPFLATAARRPNAQNTPPTAMTTAAVRSGKI